MYATQTPWDEAPVFSEPDAKNIRRVNCPQLEKHILRHEKFLSIREMNGIIRRYRYTDGVYRLVTDDDIRAIIKDYIAREDARAVKMRDVDETFRLLITGEMQYDPVNLNCNDRLINFENGILDLHTMQMTPHTPQQWMSVRIPCRFDPDAPEPEVFNRFLDDLTGGDADTRELLLEYMGACLSNIRGYWFKKALFLVGPGNTGKSQLRALIERLLGNENVCAIDLSQLEERFGTAMLYGKRLAGCSDSGFFPVSQMKIFKQLTGGDAVFMERKGKDGFHAVYTGYLWFCMNELPRFGGDRGKWVYDRMLIVPCKNVIPPEKQDKRLLEKMYAEREGIIRLCIQALRHAVERGYSFTIPDAVAQAQSNYELENSPCVQFYVECCEGWGGEFTPACTVRFIRRAFNMWCAENGYRETVTPQRFNKEIASFLSLRPQELLRRQSDVRGYQFCLSESAMKAYTAQAR